MVPGPTVCYRKHFQLQGAAPEAARSINVVHHTCAFLKFKESECQNIPRALDRGVTDLLGPTLQSYFLADVRKYKSNISMTDSYR